MSISSILIFILVLAFLEFCVFLYFTPNIMKLFIKNKNDYEANDDNDDEIEVSYLKENDKPIINNKIDTLNDDWVTDELDVDDDFQDIPKNNEKWTDDILDANQDTVDAKLLAVDPDFKIDQFYLYVFDLYSHIAESYSSDNLRDASIYMSKELYQENVRQLDYFRRKNMQHIIQVKEFLNCQIMDTRLIDSDLYLKIELTISCYDYIINRSNSKVIKGTSDKPLLCTFHMIFKRKIKQLRFSRSSKYEPVIPEIKQASTLNDEDWLLISNKIVRRRSK